MRIKQWRFKQERVINNVKSNRETEEYQDRQEVLRCGSDFEEIALGLDEDTFSGMNGVEAGLRGVK